jgi:acetyl esterase/lipase
MPDIVKQFLRLVGVTALLLGAPAASAAEPPPLSAYGSMPDIESVALSHGGDRIAAVMTQGGERFVILLTSDLRPLHKMKLDDAKVRGIEWIGDDCVAVLISRTEQRQVGFIGTDRYETLHAFLLPADDTQDARMVFDKDPSILNAVFGSYGTRSVGGRWQVFFGGRERDRGARGYAFSNRGPGLFAIDPANGNRREVAAPGSMGEGYDWLLGANGEVAATFGIDISRGTWRVEAPGGKVLASGSSINGDADLVALGRDGRTVIYSDLNEAEGVTYWFEVPLDGSTSPAQFAKAGEIEQLFTDRATGSLLGVLRSGTERPEFFDPRHQAAIARIYQAFPGLLVDLKDWTSDFSRVLVRTTGNGDSGTWYFVDLAKMSAKALGYEREAIGPEHVGAISRIRYTAGDGLELEGILTLPPGREAKNLPVVLLPHGGPHAHDEPVFDWWAQAFASRGYAVFQPNFRGSTNRDEAFMRASFGQWGRAMQTDISDALAELAREGVVDPQRACIMGGSYGGYAALAGVTLQQGIYRCAVAVAPVADLPSFFTEQYNDRGRSGMLRRSLLEELGPRSGFDEISPRRHAARADAPILLIHGKDDSVVPFEQSAKMANALEEAGKPHRLVVLSEEDHWLSRAATRLQMLEEAVAFVQQHNPPDPR